MNTESPSPWLELDDNTEFLCGNKAGFGLLAVAINQVLEGERTTVDLSSSNLPFSGIQLQEAAAPPPPAETALIRMLCYSLLSVLVLVLALAVFGFFQLLHLIFSN